jgi:hypothetical protein
MGAIEAIRKALADLESDNVLPRPGRPDDPSSTPATSQGSRRVHIPRHDCHSFFHSSRAVRDRG